MGAGYCDNSQSDHYSLSAYSPLLLEIYQHILFNFELWTNVDDEVRIAHIQYLSVIIKDNMALCRKHYGVQFMLDAARLYCSSQATPLIEGSRSRSTVDTASVLRRAIFVFHNLYYKLKMNVVEVAVR
eukprot:sb/3475343/